MSLKLELLQSLTPKPPESIETIQNSTSDFAMIGHIWTYSNPISTLNPRSCWASKVFLKDRTNGSIPSKRCCDSDLRQDARHLETGCSWKDLPYWGFRRGLPKQKKTSASLYCIILGTSLDAIRCFFLVRTDSSNEFGKTDKTDRKGFMPVTFSWIHHEQQNRPPQWLSDYHLQDA